MNRFIVFAFALALTLAAAGCGEDASSAAPVIDGEAPVISLELPEGANATNTAVSVTVTADESCTLKAGDSAVTCGAMTAVTQEGKTLWTAAAAPASELRPSGARPLGVPICRAQLRSTSLAGCSLTLHPAALVPSPASQSC